MKAKRGFGLRSLAVAGLVAAASANSGCAFFDRNITLEYKESVCGSQEGYTPGLGFVLGDFDSRVELDKKGRAKVGCVRNGYGWKTAKVLAKNNPGEWLRGAITQELENIGYKQVEQDAPRIEGTLSHLYVDLFMNLNTQVSLILRVEDEGKTVYVDAFNGSASPLAWFASGEEYKKAANQGLQNALRTAIPRLAHKLEELAEEPVSVSVREE